MSKTQLHETLFIILLLAIIAGLVFLIIVIRRQISKYQNSTAIKITLTTLLTIEYIVLLIWTYNALTYKIGYHSVVTENWLERNQSLDTVNIIQTPYWWVLLISLPLTFSFDKHFIIHKNTFRQTLITALIPMLIVISILVYNYYLIQRHPSVEFNG
jgi:hypothetical protein